MLFTLLLLCLSRINIPHVCFSFFIFFCFHIICLVMHLCPVTNRVYQVVQRLSFSSLFFLKVVHHIHEWRAAKLQTCFSKDTGCRNQSTLTMSCECLEFPCSYFSAICKRHLLISQQSNPLRPSEEVYFVL